jgi:hypothetical protein
LSKNLYEKRERIMLMKLTTGGNFTNILQAAFRHANPDSTKKTVKLSVFFVLLGSALAKAACRMLMKLTPCLRIVQINRD